MKLKPPPSGLFTKQCPDIEIIYILYSSDIRFYHIHGRNARISNNGLTASRPRAYSEFSEAIVICNRPLRDGELFEVVIEKMVDRWSCSIEAGTCQELILIRARFRLCHNP